LAQRIRVRNVFVRGEHSSEGKSDLSTRRSVPMASRLARELDAWSRRTVFNGDEDLVFAHPHTGRPIDRSRASGRRGVADGSADAAGERLAQARGECGVSGRPQKKTRIRLLSGLSFSKRPRLRAGRTIKR
jgi:hypothetical protein